MGPQVPRDAEVLRITLFEKQGVESAVLRCVRCRSFLEGMFKLCPPPRVFESSVWEGPRICVSNKFPGVADAAVS